MAFVTAGDHIIMIKQLNIDQYSFADIKHVNIA